MQEAPITAPTPPQAPDSTPPKVEAQKPRKPHYTLPWDPVGKFDEETLFVQGRIQAKFWLSSTITVVFRSLLGEEIDKINEAVKVGKEMSIGHFNTEITYQNYAYSLVRIRDEDFSGTLEEKLAKIRALPAPILIRLQLAYLEFNDHIDDLFVGKEVLDLAKKS